MCDLVHNLGGPDTLVAALFLALGIVLALDAAVRVRRGEDHAYTRRDP